jgi:uncharacterized protein (TIGR00369 family)
MSDILNADIRQKIEQSFDRQGLMETFQARITHLEKGGCEISAPVRPQTSQQHGFAHAGLTFALGDSAAGYAALSVMTAEAEVLTVEMKINLMAPAQGPNLVARGRVIKPGRRLVVVAAEVFSVAGDQETQVALLQGTMIPVGS